MNHVNLNIHVRVRICSKLKNRIYQNRIYQNVTSVHVGFSSQFFCVNYYYIIIIIIIITIIIIIITIVIISFEIKYS